MKRNLGTMGGHPIEQLTCGILPHREYEAANRSRGPITKNQAAALLKDFEIRPFVVHPTVTPPAPAVRGEIELGKRASVIFPDGGRDTHARLETEDCGGEAMAYLLCGVLLVAISFGLVVLDDLTGRTSVGRLVRLCRV